MTIITAAIAERAANSDVSPINASQYVSSSDKLSALVLSVQYNACV